MNAVLFVCASWRRIGLGHLKRCLSLAAYSQEQGMEPTVLVLGDKDANSVLKETSIEYKLASYPGFIQIDAITSELYKKKYELIVFDMSIQDLFEKDPQEIKSLFKILKSRSLCLMAIDALGKYSLLHQKMVNDIDILITPYICEIGEAETHNLIHLHGPKYALLSEEYSNFSLRRITSIASNLLITCGGSDPTETTLLAIKAAGKIETHLNLRVIIGPLFSDSLEMRIREEIDKLDHFCEIIQKPKSLREHLLWCDVAISASGLTKYELAATSTPSIIFSIDSYHDDVNRIFANKKTSINIGHGPSEDSIVKAMHALINDKRQRSKLAKAGHALIDLKGQSRIFDAALSFIEQSQKC